jgi:hypothetical protein
MKQALGLTSLLEDPSDVLCTGDRFLKTSARIALTLLNLQTLSWLYPTGTKTSFVVPIKRFARAILKANCNVYTLIFRQVLHQYDPSWWEKCLPLPPERPNDFMEALRWLHCTRRQLAKYAVTLKCPFLVDVLELWCRPECMCWEKEPCSLTGTLWGKCK